MQVSDFSYKLPEQLIAKHPASIRGTSRLMVLRRETGSLEHCKYRDLANYLNKGDVVVLNDTKVIKARLQVKNKIGQNRELLLLEKHSGDNDRHVHKALYRGAIKAGENLSVGKSEITVKKIKPGGVAIIQSKQDLLKLARDYGSVPLPPYIKRQATAEDFARYQTVFANEPGSVAAPTASLNFTKQLVNEIESKGVVVAYLTLHVGMGTFLPIRAEKIENHKMHEEYFQIPKAAALAIKSAKAAGNKVLAVGTTVTRTLEYCSGHIMDSHTGELSGEADIFIYPGYKFRVVDNMLTNFHAPKSTVLMMAAAFAGWDNLEPAYAEAIKQQYAMLSYGDSMLII